MNTVSLGNHNMAPYKRQVKARRHLVCDHFHSFVYFALSGCVKLWAETMEEGFTFQCMESGMSYSRVS